MILAGYRLIRSNQTHSVEQYVQLLSGSFPVVPSLVPCSIISTPLAILGGSGINNSLATAMESPLVGIAT